MTKACELTELDKNLLFVTKAARAGFKSAAILFHLDSSGVPSVVRCARRSKLDGRTKRSHFVLSIGKANYAERAKWAKWKRAGKKLPQKILVTYPTCGCK
jgi:hypothetical protein